MNKENKMTQHQLIKLYSSYQMAQTRAEEMRHAACQNPALDVSAVIADRELAAARNLYWAATAAVAEKRNTVTN
jgi:hypothetical protein|tara:strand:- start:1278 stop:1499 length:222 start_codon:yes stop_codon:yes gene_type:complete